MILEQLNNLKYLQNNSSIRNQMTTTKIPVFSIDEEIKQQLRTARDLLDSILETFEIMEDQELMEEIKKAEEDIKNGNVISLDEFKRKYLESE
jgi:hypothetical protein